MTLPKMVTVTFSSKNEIRVPLYVDLKKLTPELTIEDMSSHNNRYNSKMRRLLNEVSNDPISNNVSSFFNIDRRSPENIFNDGTQTHAAAEKNFYDLYHAVVQLCNQLLKQRVDNLRNGGQFVDLDKTIHYCLTFLKTFEDKTYIRKNVALFRDLYNKAHKTEIQKNPEIRMNPEIMILKDEIDDVSNQYTELMDLVKEQIQDPRLNLSREYELPDFSRKYFTIDVSYQIQSTTLGVVLYYNSITAGITINEMDPGSYKSKSTGDCATLENAIMNELNRTPSRLHFFK